MCVCGWGGLVYFVLSQRRLFLEMKTIGEVFTADQVATGTVEKSERKAEQDYNGKMVRDELL